MARYNFYHIRAKISDYNYSDTRYYHPNCMSNYMYCYDTMGMLDRYSLDGFYDVCDDNDYYKLNNIRLQYGEKRTKKSIHNWYRKDDCMSDIFIDIKRKSL